MWFVVLAFYQKEPTFSRTTAQPSRNFIKKRKRTWASWKRTVGQETGTNGLFHGQPYYYKKSV